jgi:L-lactate dehydrogenase
MNIGIVGTGLVGSTAAYAIIMRGLGRKIVLVDKDIKRSIAEANDLQHAIPFANPLTVRHGDYKDLAELNRSAEILRAEIEKINI